MIAMLIASLVTLITMLVALPVSYALGRLNFRGKNALLFAIISTRSYPPIAIIIPRSRSRGRPAPGPAALRRR